MMFSPLEVIHSKIVWKFSNRTFVNTMESRKRRMSIDCNFFFVIGSIIKISYISESDFAHTLLDADRSVRSKSDSDRRTSQSRDRSVSVSQGQYSHDHGFLPPYSHDHGMYPQWGNHFSYGSSSSYRDQDSLRYPYSGHMGYFFILFSLAISHLIVNYSTITNKYNLQVLWLNLTHSRAHTHTHTHTNFFFIFVLFDSVSLKSHDAYLCSLRKPLSPSSKPTYGEQRKQELSARSHSRSSSHSNLPAFRFPASPRFPTNRRAAGLALFCDIIYIFIVIKTSCCSYTIFLLNKIHYYSINFSFSLFKQLIQWNISFYFLIRVFAHFTVSSRRFPLKSRPSSSRRPPET